MQEDEEMWYPNIWLHCLGKRCSFKVQTFRTSQFYSNIFFSHWVNVWKILHFGGFCWFDVDMLYATSALVIHALMLSKWIYIYIMLITYTSQMWRVPNVLNDEAMDLQNANSIPICGFSVLRLIHFTHTVEHFYLSKVTLVCLCVEFSMQRHTKVTLLR